jgi:ribokinase
VTRVTVVGHVEWVHFIAVERFPARGAVTAADAGFAHAGGGAVVAAAVLAELGAEVDFFCAPGRDANGEAAVKELEARGVTVHAGWRDAPTRGIVTFLEAGGERTIITLGERLEPAGDDPLPWAALERADGVYFTAGDAGAARAAARAGVLVATPRARDGLAESGVAIDAIVFSAGDSDEHRWAQPFESRTRLMVQTEGTEGGCWWGESTGRWRSVPAPGPVRDDYGCGDAFAAGLTLGLARGETLAAAAAVGATIGAEVSTRAGAP